MLNFRRVGVGLIVLGAAAAVGGAYAMSQRVEQFNSALPGLFHFQTEDKRSFVFKSQPVKITDAQVGVPDNATGPGLRLSFGDQQVTFAVHPPVVPDHKDLSVYDEWVRVVAFTPVEGGRIEADKYSDQGWRLAVVNRQTAPGYDQETHGSVRVRNWTFELYELAVDDAGKAQPIKRRVVQFRDRRGRLPAEVDARRELAKAGKPDPGPDVRLTDVEPIEERSWEWQAALFTVPKAHISRYRFRTDAVDGSDDAPGMGWTLPVTGFGVLGALGGALLLMMQATRRR
jgi:hypothetical protein